MLLYSRKNTPCYFNFINFSVGIWFPHIKLIRTTKPTIQKVCACNSEGVIFKGVLAYDMIQESTVWDAIIILRLGLFS